MKPKLLEVHYNCFFHIWRCTAEFLGFREQTYGDSALFDLALLTSLGRWSKTESPEEQEKPSGTVWAAVVTASIGRKLGSTEQLWHSLLFHFRLLFYVSWQNKHQHAFSRYWFIARLTLFSCQQVEILLFPLCSIFGMYESCCTTEDKSVTKRQQEVNRTT